VYGKALANGYPIAALGGRADLMALCVDPDAARRVLIAGTYNAHPVPVAAAIATIDRLADGSVFAHLEALGARLETLAVDLPVVTVRQGSCLCFYFMDHAPRDWHDLAAHNDGARDVAMRQWLIERGVYTFPLAAKQWSISAAHTEADIDETGRLLREFFTAA
jgi:glutamate-1-semialdehyde 2,1-aminomutase